MTNKDGLGWVLWWCLVLSAVPVAADQLAVGDRLPALTLHDQHDQTTAIAQDTRLLLVAVEKPAADLVTAYLEEQPAGFLQRNAAVYLMDISAMPKMITRMFALPKMRKRPYRILLAEDADTLAFLPRHQNQVTVISLDKGRVERLDFVADESGLSAVF